jgi:hypothetical protein
MKKKKFSYLGFYKKWVTEDENEVFQGLCAYFHKFDPIFNQCCPTEDDIELLKRKG